MARRKKSTTMGRLIWLPLKLFLYIALFSILWVAGYAIIPPPTTATMLFDDNGATSDWVPLEDISPFLVRAVIAAEDGKFCTHRGFDQEAIADAMRRNAEGGRIRGGSTISQQTAKNAFLWQGGGYFRKALEAWFTFWIETFWSKARIVEVYLNIAETGIGTYGAEAGALRYFDKPASQLTRSEAARMAAALPLPKKRAVKNPSGFVRRYGNTIAARIDVVKRDGLDNCVYD